MKRVDCRRRCSTAVDQPVSDELSGPGPPPTSTPNRYHSSGVTVTESRAVDHCFDRTALRVSVMMPAGMATLRAIVKHSSRT